MSGGVRRPLDVITGLDAARVWRTCTNFPHRHSFNPQEIVLPTLADVGPAEDLYDPAFVLAVFAAVLADGELGLGNELSGLDWVEVVRTNVLGLAVCSLGSRKLDVRQMASFVLAKAYAYISVRTFCCLSLSLCYLPFASLHISCSQSTDVPNIYIYIY